MAPLLVNMQAFVGAFSTLHNGQEKASVTNRLTIKNYIVYMTLHNIMHILLTSQSVSVHVKQRVRLFKSFYKSHFYCEPNFGSNPSIDSTLLRYKSKKSGLKASHLIISDPPMTLMILLIYLWLSPRQIPVSKREVIKFNDIDKE